MISLLTRDEGSVRAKREMDSGIGYQVGLELSQIAVETAFETETDCYA
jgi:hypothetical protein